MIDHDEVPEVVDTTIYYQGMTDNQLCAYIMLVAAVDHNVSSPTISATRAIMKEEEAPV